MSSIAEVLGAAAVSAVMGTLVAAKAEQQLLDMLQGKAFRLHESEELARQYFVEERRWIHSGIFVAGVVVMTLGLVMIDRHPVIAWVGGAAGLALMTIGVVERLRRFRRADERLVKHHSRA